MLGRAIKNELSIFANGPSKKIPTLLERRNGTTQWFPWLMMSLAQFHALKSIALVRLTFVDLNKGWANSSFSSPSSEGKHSKKGLCRKESFFDWKFVCSLLLLRDFRFSTKLQVAVPKLATVCACAPPSTTSETYKTQIINLTSSNLQH